MYPYIRKICKNIEHVQPVDTSSAIQPENINTAIYCTSLPPWSSVRVSPWTEAVLGLACFIHACQTQAHNLMHTQQQGHCLMWETWKVYQRLFLLGDFLLQKKILDPISNYAWLNNHISTTSLKVSIASMDFSLPSAAHSYFYRYCNFPFRLSKSSVKYLQNVCLPRVFH